MCVCLHPQRTLITIHMKGMHNNQLNQFYGFSVSLKVLAVNKVDGLGLSNTTCHECVASGKEDKVNTFLATESGILLPSSGNKMGCLSYKGD